MSCATHPTLRSGRCRVAAVVLCVASLLSLGAGADAAQQVQIQVARGPHYVGEAIDLHVVAEGFEEEPAPEIITPNISKTEGALQYIGVTPKVSSSISIINGQMTRSHEVTFAYRYRYLTQQAGTVRIDPFTVSQRGVSRTTARIELRVREVPTSNAIDVLLELPEGPIFIGQKVPVFIEFWVDREIWDDLVSYALVVPLMSLPNLRFMDDTGGARDTELQIQTDAGTLLLPALTSNRIRNGRNYVVIRAQRTMVVLSPGMLEAPAATVVINQGTRFRSDMFRQRKATAVRKLMAKTDDISIEVAEVPLAGRPPSFAGAIGRGYTLEVAADRSVVQLGEPIALSFTLRGDGDLSTAGLPPLGAEGLFDASLFRLPDDRATGLIQEDEAGAKAFDVNVRVLDAAVREIPALAYSWFDIDSRSFQTTYSRPIALSVGAAQVIGAEQVERRPGDPDDPNNAGAINTAATASDDASQHRLASLSLTGANLAVDRDPALLLRDERADGVGGVVAGSLYGLGLTVIGLALFDRRRRDVDPAVTLRERALAKARREVDAALSRPERQAAETASRALRQMLALCPDASSSDLDALLGELDTRSYAPPNLDETPLSDDLCARARELATAIQESGS